MKNWVIAAALSATSLATPAHAVLTEFDITTNGFTSVNGGPTRFGPVTLSWLGDPINSSGAFFPPGGHHEQLSVTPYQVITPLGTHSLNGTSYLLHHDFSSAGSFWNTPVGALSSFPLQPYQFGDVVNLLDSSLTKWVPASGPISGGTTFQGTSMVSVPLPWSDTYTGGPVTVQLRLNGAAGPFGQVELDNCTVWDGRTPISSDPAIAFGTLNDTVTFSFRPAPPNASASLVPEASTLALAVTGLAAIEFRRRKTVC